MSVNRVPKRYLLMEGLGLWKTVGANIAFLTLLRQGPPLFMFLRYLAVAATALAVVFTIGKALGAIVFFRWGVTDSHGVVVSSGFLQKRTISVDAGDMQSVTYRSPFLYRLLHGVEATIYLPDVGDRSRLVIPMLTPAQQTQLRSLECFFRKGALCQQVGGGDGGMMRPVPVGRMLASSLLSFNYVYILTAFTFIADILDKVSVDLYSWWMGLQRQHLVLSCLILVVASILAAILKQLINYSNFSLINSPTTLTVRNGLVDTASVSINKQSVSGFIFTSDLGQRILGLVSVRAVVPGAEMSGGKAKTEMILPYQSQDEIAGRLKRMFPAMDESLFAVDRKERPRTLAPSFVVLATMGLTVALAWRIHYAAIAIVAELAVFWLVATLMRRVKFDPASNTLSVREGIVTRSTYLVEGDCME